MKKLLRLNPYCKCGNEEACPYMGKINILRSTVLPIILYPASVLYVPGEVTLTTLFTILYGQIKSTILRSKC